MEVAEGHRDSFLILPNNRIVNPFAINLEASTFKYFTSIDQYHIRQKTIDYIQIYLKANDCGPDCQFIANEFEALPRKFLNIKENDVRLQTSFVDNLNFSSDGKLASISSELPLSNIEEIN